MLDPRWRKVARDIGQHRARSLLVVLAMATGLTGAGAILDTWALVKRATVDGYRASLPASATLGVRGVDEAMLARVRAMPGIAAARTRRSAMAAVQGQGPWRNAHLIAIDDFNAADLGKLQPDGGAWPPPDGTLAIERSALEFAAATVGDDLGVKTGAAEPQSVRVSGVVRDVSLAPGWMEHVVYAFATRATLAKLGLGAESNELQIRVADANADRDAVRKIAGAVRGELERSGARVTSMDVPVPGRHIHAGQIDSLLATQLAFGVLALGACALLVVNLFNTMLAGEARQIGIMKVLGANPAQVGAMFFAMAAALGLAASIVALPLAAWIGLRYAALKAELLNFPMAGLAIPAWPIALQLAVGVLLPVAAVAWPVRRACRAPVGETLRDIGIVASGQALAARRIGNAAGLSRPLLLSIGNAFRRRSRMLLTLLALAAGGAVLVGAANLRGAVIASVGTLFAAQHFDVSLRLAEGAPVARIETTALGLEGVDAVESWRGARATLVTADGADGDALTMIGIPSPSRLLQPKLRSGRWIAPGDDAALVVSEIFARERPGLAPGAVLTLAIDGVPRPWTVVGIVDSGPQPIAYATRGAIDALRGDALATTLVVKLASASAAGQLDTVLRLRSALAEAGMPVAGSQLQIENRRVIEDHLVMVVDFLGAMGWVMIAIGGMGLASTMGMAVLERRREIGVLRAIGASGRAIMMLLQAEGMVITLLAWAACLPLSVPIGALMAEAFGRIMFPVPVPLMPDAFAALRWLAIMASISVIACAWAARRALRVPTAQALAYE